MEEDYNAYTIKRNTESTINLSFLVSTGKRTVIVRVKDQSILDLSDMGRTNRELNVLLFLEQSGRDYKVLRQFQNGYIVDFVPGTPLEILQIAEESPNIAKTMGLLHATMIEGQARDSLFFSIWDSLQSWLTLSQQHLSPDQHNYYLNEISLLRTEIPNDRHVLAHNDLNYGNIIKQDDGTIVFVDFEFGGITERCFDIANHFVEWAGQDCNWTRYPNTSQKREFLASYLSHLNQTTPTDAEVSQLQCMCDKYELLSHIYWAFWGEIMHSFRPTYSYYLPYATMRKARYESVKQAVLANTCPRDGTPPHPDL